MRSLRGPVSGLAIPHYVVDLPGGKGKVPVGPNYVESETDRLEILSPGGERVVYPEIEEEGMVERRDG
jgi:lysine 2,3-aminomutase